MDMNLLAGIILIGGFFLFPGGGVGPVGLSFFCFGLGQCLIGGVPVRVVLLGKKACQSGFFSGYPGVCIGKCLPGLLQCSFSGGFFGSG